MSPKSTVLMSTDWGKSLPNGHQQDLLFNCNIIAHTAPTLSFSSLYSAYHMLQALTHLVRLVQVLLCLGQTDSIVAEIIDRVPTAEEGITKDGQWAYWFWEIHSHEAGDA